MLNELEYHYHLGYTYFKMGEYELALVYSKRSSINKNTILVAKFVMPTFAWEMLSLP